METGNPGVIRKLNRDAVLGFIRQSGACSRAALAKALNLAPATVSAVVKELISIDLLMEPGFGEEPHRSPGRPPRLVTLNPKAGYVFGFVLEITDARLSIAAMKIDYSGAVDPVKRFPIKGRRTLKAIETSTLEAFKALKKTLPRGSSVMGLAIGIPGVVRNQEILHAPRLPALLGTGFHETLARKTRIPVYLENDVNLGLFSEAKFCPSLRQKNFGYLVISEGVGSGLSLADGVWTSRNWAGEIGHVPLPVPGHGLQTLESVIGLDGSLVTELKALGVQFKGDDFQLIKPGTGARERRKIHDLIKKYIEYLSVAIQCLNSSVGLDELILNSRETGFLNHVYPALAERISESPLKLSLSLSHKADDALIEGAALYGLHHSLPGIDHDKLMAKGY